VNILANNIRFYYMIVIYITTINWSHAFIVLIEWPRLNHPTITIHDGW
jgi:hypothetical protein